MRRLTLFPLALVLAVSGCGGGSAASLRGDAYEYDDSYSRFDDEGDEGEEGEEEEGVEDGVHSATVEYYNPETGHSATYDLDVEVDGGEVVRIDFPNGGWEDDFSPEEVDADGNAFVEDYDGRQFNITINP